jgi:hypothetical protein
MNSKIIAFFGIYFFVILTNEWDTYFPKYTISNLIQHFNHKMLFITKQYEHICLNLMKDVYDIHQQLQEQTIKDHLNEEKQQSMNIIMSGTKSILLPTYVNIVETIYFTMDKFVSYISENHFKISDIIQINNNIDNKNNNELIYFDADAYMLSNIYCLNTFHLHIEEQTIDNETNSKQLILIGDKLDYYFMLQWVEQNIQLIKNTYRINNKNANNNLIISIRERLTMLYNIVQQLYILVHHSFNNTINISNHNKYYEMNSLNNLYTEYIQIYLDEILDELNSMSNELQRFFPIQEKEKQRMLELTKQKKVLQEMDYNITLIETEGNEHFFNSYFIYTQSLIVSTTNNLLNIFTSPINLVTQYIKTLVSSWLLICISVLFIFWTFKYLVRKCLSISG